MGNNQFDGANVCPQRHRACTALRTISPEPDEALAIRTGDLECAKFALEHLQRRAFVSDLPAPFDGDVDFGRKIDLR